MNDIQTRDWYKDSFNLEHKQIKYVEQVRSNYSIRHQLDLRHLRLYGVSALFGGTIDPLSSIDDSKIRLGLNVVKSIIDTAYNKIARQYVKPMFLTDGSDWLMKKKAEKLGKFVEGVFYENDFNHKCGQVFKSGGVHGSCFTVWDNPKSCEVVHQSDVIIDESEGKYGEVYQFHIVKFVSKEFLINKYPKKKVSINLSKFETDYNTTSIYPDSTVKWVRSYVKLDGKVRFISSCTGGVLADETLDMDFIPVCKFDIDEPIVGYFGRGFAEQLTNIQLEINKTLRTISLAMHLGAIPKVFVEMNSRVVKAQLNNEVGGIISYFGQKPSYDQVMKVPPELWTYLGEMYNKAFELMGFTQMTSQGEVPPFESGKALRTFHDIESIRHAKLSQQWEKFCMDNVKTVIKMSKSYSKQFPDFKVSVIDNKRRSVLKWSDVDLSEDCYSLKPYPTAYLSELPSARFDDIQQLLSMQMIDLRQAKILMDYPDIKAIESLDNAPTENILTVLAYIVEEGKYYPPEPLQDLEYGIKIFSDAYLKYHLEGLPDDRLSLLIQWIDDAKALVDQILADQKSAVDGQANAEMVTQNEMGMSPDNQMNQDQIPM